MNRAARRSAAKRARRKSAAILSGSALATTGLSLVAAPPAAAELLPEVDTAEELVDAVEAANGDVEPDHDGIVIAEGAEISLAGELRITQPLSIYGNGAAVYAADGERIFYIEPTAGAVEIHDLALYGGGEVGGDGGAIFSRADLTLDHVRIGGFRAESDGGGLSVVGADLTIVDSSITGNSAHGNGGGIHAEGGDRVVIRHSDLGENRSYEGYGGGVYVYAHELLVDRSELAENFALTSLGYVGGDGGGLFFWGREDGAGRLNVVDSVFTANRADHEESGDTSDYLGSGGAIVVGGEARYVDIRRSAFVENEAERGGSIHADAAGLEIVVSDSEFIGDRFLGDGEDVENALRDGGAIDVSIERLRISDSSFEALFAEAGDGGAIRTFQTDVTIERSRFAENRAIDSGGALTVVEGEAYISASLFENNEVDNQTGG
ncbi:MAG TPA: hypothetical protein VEA78_01685, partial [Acidimicrobiales bacterium]|nr:hypothetical protein [Acidimicrobiales bacterium]